MHTDADAVRESAQEVDWEKFPRPFCTGFSNPRQYCAWINLDFQSDALPVGLFPSHDGVNDTEK